MKKKRSGFWTFIFSLIPGAGEMYLGFMKRGLSIMTLFWGLCGIAILMRTEYLMIGLPIIFFYGFFDTHNLRRLSEEERENIKDDFLFDLKKIGLPENFSKIQSKVLACVITVIGVFLLWNNILSLVQRFVPEYYNTVIYQIVDMIPSIVISLLMIFVGVKLIKGKKEKIENENQESGEY